MSDAFDVTKEAAQFVLDNVDEVEAIVTAGTQGDYLKLAGLLAKFGTKVYKATQDDLPVVVDADRAEYVDERTR